MIDQPEVVAGGLLLRPWRADDADTLTRILQDPEIPRWIPLPTPYGREHADAWIAAHPAEWAAGRRAAWAVTADGAVVGSVTLSDLDRDHPEVGFWVAPAARGRGVAVTAVRAACRWALDRGAPKVLWLADVGNEASWRVAHAVGFAYEGRRRGECEHTDGRRTDAWSASLVPGVDPEPWPYEPFRSLVDGEVELRRWRVADAGRWVELNSDPDVTGWSGYEGDPEPVSEMEATIAGAYVEDFLLGRAARLAVCVGGRPVGGVSLRTPHAGTGELSWWLGPPARGRGIGSRAVRLLAGWAFGQLGLRRLSAGIHVDNAASRALAARVGFVEEGVRRLGAPAFGPGWGDAVACGLLPADLR